MKKEKFNIKDYNHIIKFIEEKNFIKAEEELFKIIDDKKDQFYSHQLLGIVYSKTGNIDKALSHYQTSINLNSKNTGALFNLAMLYKSLNKDDSAVEYFLKVIKYDPKLIEPYLYIASIYEKKKKLNEANNFYQKALSLNKDYLPTNQSYSKFLMRAGEIPKGLSYQYKYFGIIKFKSKDIKII